MDAESDDGDYEPDDDDDREWEERVYEPTDYDDRY